MSLQPHSFQFYHPNNIYIELIIIRGESYFCSKPNLIKVLDVLEEHLGYCRKYTNRRDET
jgi:hypothetical protein